MVKETKTKKIICPRCSGNGYFKVKESVDHQKDKVVQCPMCESQGELDYEEPNFDYSGINANKLQ